MNFENGCPIIHFGHVYTKEDEFIGQYFGSNHS